MKDFQNKNVYITGGSSGIGLATAKLLAEAGANLVLISRSLEKLQLAKAEVEPLLWKDGKVDVLSLNVGDHEAVKSALADKRTTFGEPDVLINCAGLAFPRKFEDIGYEQFDHIVKTNLYGTWNMCANLIAPIRERQGHIVNVSSVAGFIGVFGYTDYCATKFGIIGLSEALRSEYERDGVRISVLCPPDTDTPAFAEENRTKPEETKAISKGAKLMQPEQVADALVRGMRKEKFLIIPGFDGKLAHAAKGIAPGLVHYMMQRDIKKVGR